MGPRDGPRRALGDPLTEICLSDLSAYVSHGANGTCGPPSASLAAAVIFVIGLVGTAALWRVRARSTIALCVVFALPGWYVLAVRRIDGEPAVRMRVEVEQFAAAHQRCVALEPLGCEACDPIVRRARTPSVTCDHPAVVELHEGALGGHCVAHGDRLVCGPN
ncbi:MAG: hypothetical protein ABI321_07320 [Polyangia bacterium]